MRAPAPDERPIGLTIAGSDSGGGAGIQADLATMAAHGVYGTSVVTAVTAQHSRGVERSFVLPIEDVEAQLHAVIDDFAIRGAKTGMLATPEIVDLVAETVETVEFPLVVDPVMVATSGDRLLDPEAEAAYERLIAKATLVTPNADEAEVLTGVDVEDDESAREAGTRLLEMGADAALLKGGHVPGETVRDVLVTHEEDGTNVGDGDDAETALRTFEHPRVDTEATHGSGCTLAAAIASRLASGVELETAVETATDFLARAVRYHYDVGRGPGAVNHMVDLRNRAARAATVEDVYEVVEAFQAGDVSELIPRGGMTVVGATPYAESEADVAAIVERLTRPNSEGAPSNPVRFGAANRVARVLLDGREHAPDRRFAADCRFDNDVAEVFDELDWPAVASDRLAGLGDGMDGDGTDDDGTDDDGTDGDGTDGDGMDDERGSRRSAYRRVLAERERAPVAVVDGVDETEGPKATLLARDSESLIECVLALSSGLDG